MAAPFAKTIKVFDISLHCVLKTELHCDMCSISRIVLLNCKRARILGHD